MNAILSFMEPHHKNNTRYSSQWLGALAVFLYGGEHSFNITADKFNMRIFAEKTNFLRISKDLRKCNLETDGRIIEQVMKLNNLEEKNHWWQEYISRDNANNKSRNKYVEQNKVHKTIARLTLANAAETRIERKNTKNKKNNYIEMKVPVKGISLRNLTTL